MNDPIVFNWPAGKDSAIMVAENIIDKYICSDFVGNLKKNYSQMFAPGPTLGGINLSVKNSMDASVSLENLSLLNIPIYPIHSHELVIVEKLFQCIEYYRESFKQLWEWNSVSDTGFRVQEYKKGLGYYREHIDGGLGHKSAMNRVLAAIVYLNDVEIGGGTYFREHDVTVPPKAGSICLFPAHWTHPHQGCVPISDDKWIISTFIINTLVTVESDDVVISSVPMPKEDEAG